MFDQSSTRCAAPCAKWSAWLAIEVALIAPAEVPQITVKGMARRAGSAARASSASARNAPAW